MENLINQLESVLSKYTALQQKSKHDDFSDLPMIERQGLLTRSIAAIHRISGVKSTYSNEVERIFEENGSMGFNLSSILGIVQALKDDLQDGYVKTLVELVHADIFADFLDMAYHLQATGYKDAAAVITGSTLESHIKELCSKHNVDIEDNGKPIKTDKLNSDLAKLNVYSKLDQKNITAWLDLRNKAAHGNYSDYTTEQVELFISSVRDFIGRIAA